MKALLICPGQRPALSPLGQAAPLAATPLLGQSLVEYWLAHLALKGVKEVRILADDRPGEIGALVDNGARWGLAVEVLAESRELAPAQAQLKHAQAFPSIVSENTVAMLDHFPGAPHLPLFTSFSALFSGLIEWMPRARTPDRVGVRELRPGVWVGTRARIARDAKLLPPCWIGQNVFVGAEAVVGPMAIVEDRAFVEAHALVSTSVIGPDTFVGGLAAVSDSFALGSILVDWKTGISVRVDEPFLLSALRRPVPGGRRENIFNRIFDIFFEDQKQPGDVLSTLLEEPGKPGRLT